MSNSRFVTGAAVALVNQGWLSVVNLSIGLAFISLSSKVEYGIYVQLFTALMLGNAVQNALVTTPLNTLGPKRAEPAREALACHLFWFQTVIALLLAVLAASLLLLLGLVAGLNSISPEISLAFAAAVFTTWLREYLRHYEFFKLRAHRVLVLDLVFGVVLLSAIGFSALDGRIETATVFAWMALANIAALAWALCRSDLVLVTREGRFRDSLADTWACGRWTLPSVFVTWGYTQSYVYIAAAVIGVKATAEIAAARLLLSPIVLASTAWGKVFLPHASGWLGQGQLAYLHRMALLSLGGLSLILATYTGLLLFGYNSIETYLLGEKYAGLEFLLLLWGAYFLFNTAEIVGTHCLVSAERFRQLFLYACVALAVGLPAQFGLAAGFAEPGLLIAMSLAAATMSALVWGHGWLRLRRMGLAHTAFRARVGIDA